MSKGRKYDKIIEEDALYQIACKSAVKANKKLDEIEIKAILDKLNMLQNPYTCPHGRRLLLRLQNMNLKKCLKE